MTDNLNAIKEALEAARLEIDVSDATIVSTHLFAKLDAALALIEKGEVMWESELISYPKVLHEKRNGDAWIIQPVLVIPLEEE